MPTYDYKCDNCDHEFEIFQSMKDNKLSKCPVCGKESLKRLIGTGGGLIFKGSGFYLTDYKNKTTETSSPAASGSKETPSAKSDTETKNERSTNKPEKSETINSKDDKAENSGKKTETKTSSNKTEK